MKLDRVGLGMWLSERVVTLDSMPSHRPPSTPACTKRENKRKLENENYS